MCATTTHKAKTIKVRVPGAVQSQPRFQEEINDAYKMAAHDADRPCHPCPGETDSINLGLTKREMLAGMALPGILTRETDPVRAAGIAVRAAEAILLLSQCHDQIYLNVTPQELVAEIFRLNPDTGSKTCRCRS